MTADGQFVRGESLNDSGDIVGEYEGDPWGFDDSIFHYSQRDASGDEVGTTYTVRNLVDDPFLEGATLWQMKVTERDTSLSTPAPIIVGKAEFTADGETRTFMLIPKPQHLGDAHIWSGHYGITESPGDSASFEIVLTGEPTADVTIGISSSDTTEGTVDKTSLTFTAADWYLPQTVTITGVDDAVEDGNVEYTIDTAAAISTDPDYNGFDAADVSVTNLDDDATSLFLSVDDLAIAEGNNGTQTLQFTITLSGPASGNEQVWYAVSNGTAKKNRDYRMVDSASGSINFSAGQTTMTVAFVILGDNKRESNETFKLTLSSAVGAEISQAVGTTTILDDD